MERNRFAEYAPYFVMTLCCMVLGVIAGYTSNLSIELGLMLVALVLGMYMLRRTRKSVEEN